MLTRLEVLRVNLPCDFVPQLGRFGKDVVQPIQHFTEPLRGERLSFPIVRHSIPLTKFTPRTCEG